MIDGAILAGGQSRRFGRNKALARIHNERLIDRAIQGLRPLCRSILVIANDLLPYATAEANLVRDVLPDQGPLGGIYSALFFCPGQWIFVKATDMPFLVPEVVAAMVAMTLDADAVVPMKEGFYEPLFALYHIRCLPFIAQLLEEGEKQIIRFYPKVKLAVVKEDLWRSLDPAGLNFKNINTLEDYQQIQ